MLKRPSKYVLIRAVAEFKHQLHDQLEGLIEVDATQIVVGVAASCAINLRTVMAAWLIVSSGRPRGSHVPAVLRAHIRRDRPSAQHD